MPADSVIATTHRSSRRAAALVACAALLAASGARAQAPAPDGSWQFTLTPYLWLPNVNGKLRYEFPPGQGNSAESEIGPVDYLESLQFLLMLNGEARRGDWAVFSDLVYLDFGNTGSSVTSVGGPGAAIPIPRERNTATSTDLKGWSWALAGSYTVDRGARHHVDVLGGLRLLHIESRLDWALDASIPGSGFSFDRSGQVSQDTTLTAAIVGVRGRMAFGDEGRWFVPYYLDVGGGSHVTTWQAAVGAGYRFPWGELQASWRHLEFDQPDGRFVQNLRFSGPAVGATWRF